MSRINKNEEKAQPLSDWEITPWSPELYKLHEAEFETWLTEYRLIRTENDTAITTRWKWIEMHGGSKMKVDDYGKSYPVAMSDKHNLIASMFDRFTEWLSVKEKRSTTPEVRKEQIQNLFQGMKKPEFAIPQGIKERAESEIKEEF